MLMRWFKAKQESPDKDGRSELHYAALENDVNRARKLISAGADVNAQDKGGWTPLHSAAQGNSFDTAVLLLESGAKIDLQDGHGNTPLFRAVFSYKNDGRVIELLRKHGADAFSKNRHGQTPIGLARLIANYDVAKFFADLQEEKR